MGPAGLGGALDWQACGARAPPGQTALACQAVPSAPFALLPYKCVLTRPAPPGTTPPCRQHWLWAAAGFAMYGVGIGFTAHGCDQLYRLGSAVKGYIDVGAGHGCCVWWWVWRWWVMGWRAMQWVLGREGVLCARHEGELGGLLGPAAPSSCGQGGAA